jgi:NAD(P)-dependent dehydrogenase (short-subunit alcohol dehydrogenase family)
MVIDGNTFLVTGGGSGLGASVGRALLKRGANVAFADIDVKGAEAEAADTPNHAVAVQVDVTDGSGVEQAVAAVTIALARCVVSSTAPGLLPHSVSSGRKGLIPLNCPPKS